MKILGLLLLGLLAFVVTLLWKFPAAGVMPHVNLQPLQVSGVQGSVWSGSAASVRTPDVPQPLTNLHWRFVPTALLQASAGVEVDFEWSGGTGSAEVVRDLKGMLTVSNAVVKLPASSLEEYLPLPVATFEGMVDAALERVVVVRNRLQTTTGVVTWRNAVVSGAVNARLGEVVLDVVPEQDAHLATLQNSNGELEIKGDFRLEQNGDYRADIRVKPLPATPPALEASLGALGRPASDGSYRIKNNGNISQFM